MELAGCYCYIDCLQRINEKLRTVNKQLKTKYVVQKASLVDRNHKEPPIFYNRKAGNWTHSLRERHSAPQGSENLPQDLLLLALLAARSITRVNLQLHPARDMLGSDKGGGELYPKDARMYQRKLMGIPMGLDIEGSTPREPEYKSE